MLSIAGIYDGKSIYPIEPIGEHKSCKVTITFIEELGADVSEDEYLRNFGTTNASVTFWNDDREDIYQDYLIPQNKK